MTNAARNRLLAAIALVVIAMAGGWHFVLSPKRAEITAAEAQQEQARQTLQTAQATLNTGKEAVEAYREARPMVVRLGRIVPTRDDTASLLVQLKSISKKSGAKLTEYRVQAAADAGAAAATQGADISAPGAAAGGEGDARETAATAPAVSPGSAMIEGGLARTTLALTLTGTYKQLERFLREVQRLAVINGEEVESTKGRLFVIDGVAYVPEGEPDSAKKNVKLKATMNASVFYAPPLETPSPAAAGAPAPAGDPAAGGGGNGTGTAAIGGVR